MISHWRLYNFKSFREDTTVELKPLTVLAGANSSGKSTLLQSMLMVAQTLESRVTSRPVVLNGPLVRLGTFDDVRSHDGESDAVLVEFTIEEEHITAGCEVVFDGVGAAGDVARLHPSLLSTELTETRVTSDRTVRSRQNVRRSKKLPAERAKELGIDENVARDSDVLRYEFERFTDDPGKESPPYVGCTMQHFLPSLGVTKDRDDGAILKGTLVADGANRAVNNAFGRMRYLGPLRDEPRALYPLSTTADTTDVGLRGEHTAAVFDLHRQTLVRYVPASYMPSPAPNAPSLVLETKTRTLESAVTEWLKYLGVVESIEARDLGNLGHELKVTTAGARRPHDLTHVGTGVSQVLPIVVMCLLADEGATLLIEQPELHLHPRVQTLLGDFFLAAAYAGRQVIVETHSEYLVNRLRYRIAASEGDRIAQLVKTYFVEKDAKGASMFRSVEVNRYGAIPEWPKGFFDQSQREIEQILLAGATKKKAERGGGRDGKSGA